MCEFCSFKCGDVWYSLPTLGLLKQSSNRAANVRWRRRCCCVCWLNWTLIVVCGSERRQISFRYLEDNSHLRRPLLETHLLFAVKRTHNKKKLNKRPSVLSVRFEIDRVSNKKNKICKQIINKIINIRRSELKPNPNILVLIKIIVLVLKSFSIHSVLSL